MAVFQPNPDQPDVLSLLEQLGAQVAEAYTIAEIRLLKAIFAKIDAGMNVDDELRRVEALNDLALQATRILKDVDVERLVREAIETAVYEGELEATARLNLAPAINSAPVAGFAASQAQLVATLGAQLAGGLTAMGPTILRSVRDVYQQAVGEAIQQRVIDQVPQAQVRRQITERLLGQGVTGFVDKAGRNWHLGTYADMATRTASSRAFDESHIATMRAAGIQTFSIIVGSGADQTCVDWANRILTENGPTGPLQVQNVLNGEATTIEVTGTLAEARAAGWKHPNCRCRVAGYLAGLPIPGDVTTYDPKAEKARQQLRYLERRKRAALARQEFAPDDIARAQAKREVAASNKAIREHVQSAGIPRSSYRETLAFQTGKPRTP